MDTFTCHGLTRICTGRPAEKVLWFVVFAGCLGFLIYLAVEMVQEYFEYLIRTETRMVSKEEIILPTVTLCLEVGFIFDYGFHVSNCEKI